MFNLFTSKNKTEEEFNRYLQGERKIIGNEDDWDDDLCVVTHFTPNANYLYVWEQENCFYESDYFIGDIHNGNELHIRGNYILIEIDHYSEINKIIRDYQLENMNVPLIKLDYREMH